MRLKIMLAAVLTAGLLAAGCGGDDDETTTTTTTTAGATGATGASGAEGAEAGGGLLPDDFAQEANDVCAQGNAEIDEEAGKVFGGGGEPSPEEQAKFVEDAVIPSIESQIEDIRALGAPDEGAEELDAALSDAEDALDEVRSNPEILTGGDDPFADVNKQLAELGLPACAG
jgi:hypothetical protein